MLLIRQHRLFILLIGTFLNLVFAADSSTKPNDPDGIEVDAFIGANLDDELGSGRTLNGKKSASLTNEDMNITLKVEGNSIVAYWHKYIDLFATYKEPVWKDSVEKWKIPLPIDTKPSDILVHLDRNGGRIDATREYAVIYVKKKIFAVVEVNSGNDLKGEYWNLLERRMEGTKAMDRAWSRVHPHQDGCWKALGE